MSLDLGIHTPHLWIRSFQCLLHIGHRRRQGFNDPGLSRRPGFNDHGNTDKKKESIENKKKRIQEKIKDALGLVVNVPRSGGSGT